MMQINAKKIQMSADLNQESYIELKAELVSLIARADGSKFTKEQVELLITAGKINGEYNFSDCITVYNCLNLFDYLIDNLDLSLNANLVRDMHSRLVKNTAEDVQFKEAGEYRNLAMTMNIAEFIDFDEQLDMILSKPILNLTELGKFLIEFDRLKPFRQHNLMIVRFLCFYLSLKTDLEFVYLHLNNREYEIICKKAQIIDNQTDLLLALKEGLKFSNNIQSLKIFS